jgi:F0F1-type ATP synthase assembly protein I
MSAMLSMLTDRPRGTLRMESDEKPALPQRRKKAGSGIAIGIVLGIALGAALDKVGLGLAIGIIIGFIYDTAAAKKS